MAAALTFIVALLGLVASSSAKSGFLVVSPRIYRAGTTSKLTVNIVGDSCNITAKVTKRRGDTIAYFSQEFQADTFQVFDLKIPKEAPKGEAGLTLSAQCNETHTEKTIIRIEKLGKSLYIQTDKPIYKPGEKIRGRVIGIDSNLKPLNGKVEEVSISNPSGTRLMQWNDLDFEDGVAGFELPISQQPVLGSWVLKADTQGVSVQQKVDVEKYVLPKFEVVITPPSFIGLDDNKPFVTTICAKYTYGKLVNGDVKIKACMKLPWWHRGDTPEHDRCILENSKINGCYDMTLTKGQIGIVKGKSYYNARLEVFAVVTETATGISMNKTHDSTMIKTHSVQLNFDPGTPEFFKPGLPLSGVVNVVRPDKTPIDGEEVRIRAYTVEKDLFEENVTAVNGKAPFTFNVPFGMKNIRLMTERVAKGKDKFKTGKYLRAWYSPSNSFIKINKPQHPFQVGKTQKIEIASATEISDAILHHIVICKGNVHVTGKSTWSESKKVEFDLDITQSMVPKCRLVVYYIREDGEVVADNMDFNIEASFENQVSVTFSDDEVRPGKPTKLTLKAAANSRVCVSAVDKSVYLLRSGNELTEDRVMKGLEDMDVRPSWYKNRCRDNWPWRPWMRPRLGKRSVMPFGYSEELDAAHAFNSIGAVFFSNLDVETRPCNAFPYKHMAMRLDGIPGPIGAVQRVLAKTATNIREPLVEEDSAEERGQPPANEPPRVRTSFPETWLWFEEKFDNFTKEKTITTTVPDTITTWYASAFAMSSGDGVGVAQRSSITIFQPFFVSMTMPYSVIRGEEVKLIATVFNYLPGCTSVKVTLLRPSDYSFKITSQNSEKVCICSNEAKSVKYTIVPRELGHVPFTVLIKNSPNTICSNKEKPVAMSVKDAVQRKLLVEPEGVRDEYTFNTFFCPKDYPEKTYKETVETSLPKSVVEGSVNAMFSVIGDIMGPSLAGLDKLLRLPTGCGEQNMLNFAPNIYVMQYLQNTKQLTGEIKEKATGFLRTGYQRELTYKRKTGSYSAFGDRDDYGSMWLTAFVVRSFAQARPYIFIDPKELEHSMRWMTEKQLDSGCFPKHGRILHKAMKGGVSSESTLTAFVVLAMLEAGKDAKDPSVNSALNCMKESLDNVTDAYSTALFAYTYSLAQEKDRSWKKIADELKEKLMKMAVKEDGLLHWTNAAKEVKKPENSDIWISPCHRAPSAEIEMTAYAMMAIISTADSSAIGAASPIIRWISKQRNSLGGFSSTQDTCVALQALAQYAGKAYGSKQDLSVNVKAVGKSEIAATLDEDFSVTDENSLVTQRVKVPSSSVPGKVEVQATGEGCALMQVDVSYNIDDVEEEPAFDLSVLVKPAEDAPLSFDDICRPLELHVCATWKLEGVSDMAVISVKLVSGFEVDESSMEKLRENSGFKRYEIDGSTVSLYMDEILSVCLAFGIRQTSVVKNMKPGSVTVYDYYDVDKRATTMYKVTENDCYGDKVSKDCPVCTSTDNLKDMKDHLCTKEFALRARKHNSNLKVSENYKPKALPLKSSDSFYVDIPEYCYCPQIYKGAKSLIFGKVENVKEKTITLDSSTVVLDWNDFVRDQFKTVLGPCMKEK